MNKIYDISMIVMIIVAWLSWVHGFHDTFMLCGLFLIVNALDNIAKNVRNIK